MKKYKVICPLFNFQIPWNVLIGDSKMTRGEKVALLEKRHQEIIKGIDLFNGVKIRLFSKEDIKNLDSNYFPVSFKIIRELISTKTFLLESDIIVENDVKFKTDKLMRRMVLALRLFDEGHIYGDDVFYFSNIEGKWNLTGYTREGPQLTRDRFGDVYCLNLEDIPKLRYLIKKIENVDFSKRKSLELACNRFQRAYDEHNIEDQLIDYMIAFEALFLSGEKYASSRGKIIAIACSSLLGEDDAQRKEIKDVLTKAYKMRNCIVHGSDISEDNPFEIIEEIETYLRISITRFLD